MKYLYQVDAALRRVKEDNPDLDLTLLSLSENELRRDDQYVDAIHVRSALVARIADTGWSTLMNCNATGGLS